MDSSVIRLVDRKPKGNACDVGGLKQQTWAKLPDRMGHHPLR